MAASMMVEAVSTYETSVNSYQTTRRNIPEDSHLPNKTHLYIGLLHTDNHPLSMNSFFRIVVTLINNYLFHNPSLLTYLTLLLFH
jgi:hypothetical protein